MPDQLLTVVAGGPDTGKSLIAELLVREKGHVMVARDLIRPTFVNKVDEWTITLVMAEMARTLLKAGESVVTVSWNLEPDDRKLWTDVAAERGVPLRWIQLELLSA